MKRLIVCVVLMANTAVWAQERQICLDQVEARALAQYIQRTEAERDSLKKTIQDQPNAAVPAIVVGVVAALVFGGVGLAVGSQLKKP